MKKIFVAGFGCFLILSAVGFDGRAAESQRDSARMENALVTSVEFDEGNAKIKSAQPTAAGEEKAAFPKASATPPAAKISMASIQAAGPGKVDMQAPIEMVNDTLEENRKLKKDIASVQGGFERMAIENNLLKSKARTLERRLDQKDEEKKGTLSIVKMKQDEIGTMKQQSDEIQKKYLAERDKVKKAQEQISQLEEKIKSAILESERDEYRAKIQMLKGQADGAVREVSRVAASQTGLQAELGQTYFRLANQLFEERKFGESAEFYEKALHYNPRLSYAHYNLGVVYDFYLNDNQKAIAHYRSFLSLEPEDDSSGKVKERMVSLELIKNLVPDMPLRLDFNELHKKSN